jgi:hypothetical protein
MVLEAGYQWLMPLILATWDAEIRRPWVQGQPGSKNLWDPLHLNGKKLGVGGVPVIPVRVGSVKQEDCGSG